MTGTWNGRERELWDLYPDEYQAKKIQKILDAVYTCICLIDKAEDGDARRGYVEPRVYNHLLKLANELWVESPQEAGP